MYRCVINGCGILSFLIVISCHGAFHSIIYVTVGSSSTTTVCNQSRNSFANRRHTTGSYKKKSPRLIAHHSWDFHCLELFDTLNQPLVISKSADNSRHTDQKRLGPELL
ncbi:hypothetical protein J3Q64DRAFT_1238817 [Phycomyces blakesleeanus]|uniref:Secreted protein n=1 Tax=Phycomyces blakesleeanus TaxID=4837 RepID=A0ABR3BAH4_PHYBL